MLTQGSSHSYHSENTGPQPEESILDLPQQENLSSIWNELIANSCRGAIWERQAGSFVPVDHLLKMYLSPDGRARACGGYDLFAAGAFDRLANELSEILHDQGVPYELSTIEEAAFGQMLTDAVQVTALVQAISGSDRGDLIFLRGAPEPDLHVHQMQLFAFGQYRFGTRFANVQDIENYDGFSASLKSGATTYAPEPHSYVFAKGRINGDPASHAGDSLKDMGLAHCSGIDADQKRVGLVAHSYYARSRPREVTPSILETISEIHYSSLFR